MSDDGPPYSDAAPPGTAAPDAATPDVDGPVSAEDQRPDEVRRADPVELERWRVLAARVLADEDIPATAELSLAFVDEAAMAELNAEHMGSDGPTDVLAFPLDGPEIAADPTIGGGAADGPPIVLGDVVICPAVARRNAAEHAVTHDEELALLVVHGVLHVLGHDHAEPEETEVMRGRERFHLERERAAGAT
ncbi:MAG: rRNA maturation RNase YbeY [Actinomycetota bacterium]|nr:rRNA maturation RNase YbeY [Actinomycetota bacterium]